MTAENTETTTIGYINRNQQKNLGSTGEPGTDNLQYFYLMECQYCNHRYKSNGSDIFQRKCPKCQGGKP
ncbi:MAG TPA: hypothetical protein VEF53_05290 [Patescibacteria group bacterium]|nr:hypothetical protein [Patescibacteria group bacterium]